ncbi:MAG: PQQ-dependent sugar dehydrogenase [Paracoccaceae bacterium]
MGRQSAVTPLLVLVLGLTPALAPEPAIAEPERIETGGPAAEVTLVADGFQGPWSLDFLPDGGFLVTEKRGRLWHLDEAGARQEITGLPEIADLGQGGLLDVVVPRDFRESRELLFTHARPLEGGAGTALAAARWPEGSDRLEDLRILFEMTPGSSAGRHFGSRLVEGPEGHLFFTIGDRGEMQASQDLSRHNGSVIRLNRDGSVPADNPFVDESDALPEIWSYGHRNPQGAALDLDGRLWLHEHGARGGDEINRIRKGANYGWPVISYGRHYSGEPIGEGTSKPGMEQPEFYWDPSIAPSGLAIYSGELFPEWRGDFLVGSLKFDHIAVIGGDPLSEQGRIEGPQTRRVRDVTEAPDGTIWFINEPDGAIYRLAPGSDD